jgi:hypothetical protein
MALSPSSVCIEWMAVPVREAAIPLVLCGNDGESFFLTSFNEDDILSQQISRSKGRFVPVKGAAIPAWPQKESCIQRRIM